MASTTSQRQVALDKLLPYQRSDFEGIFRVMDGENLNFSFNSCLWSIVQCYSHSCPQRHQLYDIPVSSSIGLEPRYSIRNTDVKIMEGNMYHEVLRSP